MSRVATDFRFCWTDKLAVSFDRCVYDYAAKERTASRTACLLRVSSRGIVIHVLPNSRASTEQAPGPSMTVAAVVNADIPS
jgi:hypothetical protein